MNFSDIQLVKRAYFPTLIFQVYVPNPQALNDKFLETIYA